MLYAIYAHKQFAFAPLYPDSERLHHAVNRAVIAKINLLCAACRLALLLHQKIARGIKVQLRSNVVFYEFNGVRFATIDHRLTRELRRNSIAPEVHQAS